MRAHFLLWRESFFYGDIVPKIDLKLRIFSSYLSAIDYNNFISVSGSEKSYLDAIDELSNVVGVRKVISFPVTESIVSGNANKKWLILIAIRMPRKHKRQPIKKLIMNSNPIWADAVDGIFNYLICFDIADSKITNLLMKIYKHHPEFVETHFLFLNGKTCQ